MRSRTWIVLLLCLFISQASVNPACAQNTPQPPAPEPPLPPAVQPTPFLQPLAPPSMPGSNVQIRIPDNTPLSKLLPPMPASSQPAPLTGDDLTLVPEVMFESPLPQPINPNVAQVHIQQQLAKIRHLNNKKADGFMYSLLPARADLQGLPFVLGDACRSKGEQRDSFQVAVNLVRQQLGQHLSIPLTEAHNAPVLAGQQFWSNYLNNHTRQVDVVNTTTDPKWESVHLPARIAALMQVLTPESAHLRKGLVRYLSTLSHPDATRALAKLAIFSNEEEIRTAAINALKVRREKDYTDILVQGLNYPWPAVAERASAALVKLERNDLAEQLVSLLESPDPRAPVLKKIEGKETKTVRELVRINHHRNCMLCHAPASVTAGNRRLGIPQVAPAPTTSSVQSFSFRVDVADPKPPEPQAPASEPQGTTPAQPQAPTATPPDEGLVAPVPVPGTHLSASSPYNGGTPDTFIRVDVVYLRQDFSILMAVKNASPWPEMQRFDFLVRTRTLTPAEAARYEQTLRASAGSPYQRAALSALRQLTGREAATPQEWRKLLNLPTRDRSGA